MYELHKKKYKILKTVFTFEKAKFLNRQYLKIKPS